MKSIGYTMTIRSDVPLSKQALALEVENIKAKIHRKAKEIGAVLNEKTWRIGAMINQKEALEDFDEKKPFVCPVFVDYVEPIEVNV